MASLLSGAVTTAAAAPERTRPTACFTYMTELRPPAAEGPGEEGGSGRSAMSWMAGPDGQDSTRMSSPCFEPHPKGDFETSGQAAGSPTVAPGSPSATPRRCWRSPMRSGRQTSRTAGSRAALRATSGHTPKGSPVVTAIASFIREIARRGAKPSARGGRSLSGCSDPVGSRRPGLGLVRSLPEFVLRRALVVEIIATHVRESLTFCAVTPAPRSGLRITAGSRDFCPGPRAPGTELAPESRKRFRLVETWGRLPDANLPQNRPAANLEFFRPLSLPSLGLASPPAPRERPAASAPAHRPHRPVPGAADPGSRKRGPVPRPPRPGRPPAAFPRPPSSL